jgi:stage II sporulation protein AB (anti-sigma F factor)
MEVINYFILEFPGISENESFARVAIASFVTSLDPKLDVLTDVKTAVSEGVTNAIIHGYEGKEGLVTLTCTIYNNKSIMIEIIDKGKGIEDIEKAREPLYTSKPELERSGMGFTLIESFMDRLEVISTPGKGTTLKMFKKIYDESN